jgi:hypothetical protein
MCRLYLWGVIIPPGGGVLEPARMVSVINVFFIALYRTQNYKKQRFFFIMDKSLTNKALFV